MGNLKSNLTFYLLISFFLMLPAHAENTEMDQLFIGLKNANNEEVARDFENRIWQQWFKSGHSTIDAQMQQAMDRRQVYDFNGALEILNDVIKSKPTYAEAWNQRATVYFHQREFEKSLEDVAQTLQLEPRHFGAMAGRAVIRLMQSKPALARQNVLEALKLHPYLKERAFFPDLGK